jgi:uncharacterized membrane protein
MISIPKFLKNNNLEMVIIITMFTALVISAARFFMPIADYTLLLKLIYGDLYSSGFDKQNIEIKNLIDFHILISIIYIGLFIHQFSVYLRRNYKNIHRLVGYIFVLTAILSAFSGLLIALIEPFGGKAESILSIFTFIWFVFCLYLSIRLARTSRYVNHRAWMLRSFAIPVSAIFMRIPFSLSFLIFERGNPSDFIVSAIITHITVILFIEIYIIKNKELKFFFRNLSLHQWKR